MPKLKDFDVWYKQCECGYDTGKSTIKTPCKCWKCGRQLYRDYSNRALKISGVEVGFARCHDLNGGLLVAMIHREQLYKKCSDGAFRLIKNTSNLYRHVLKLNVYKRKET